MCRPLFGAPIYERAIARPLIWIALVFERVIAALLVWRFWFGVGFAVGPGGALELRAGSLANILRFHEV